MSYEKHCNVCGYDWISRVKDPKKCPSCGSYHWSGDSAAGKTPKRPKIPKNAERRKKCASCGVFHPLSSHRCSCCGSREFRTGPYYAVPASKETLESMKAW